MPEFVHYSVAIPAYLTAQFAKIDQIDPLPIEGKISRNHFT